MFPLGTSGNPPSKYATPEPSMAVDETSIPQGCHADEFRLLKPAVRTALSVLKIVTWASFTELMYRTSNG